MAPPELYDIDDGWPETAETDQSLAQAQWRKVENRTESRFSGTGNITSQRLMSILIHANLHFS